MRPLPELTAEQRVVLDLGRRRAACASRAAPTARRSCTRRCRSARRAAAGRGSRRPVSGRATVVGFTVNAHQWLPGLRPRPYVDRRRRPRGGRRRPAHHQHRRLRARRGAHRPGGRGPLRAARRRLAPAVRADRRATTRRPGARAASGRRPRPPLTDDRFEHRVGALGHRPLGDRPPAHGRPAVAHRRRLPRGGRRRRPRPSTTSTGSRPTPGAVGMGMSEGGVTAVEEALRHPPDVDQRRRRPPRPGGSVDRRDAGRGQRACAATSCASAPCGSRPTPRSASAGGGRAARRGWMQWRLPFGAHVGGQLDRHERQPVPAPLRRHPGDARLHRPQRPGQRRPQPGGDLPRPDDDGRLPVGPADHHAVRALRLRRARATRRSPSSCPTPSVAADLPKPADPDRGGRHADPRAGLVGPGHRHPRAAGARPVGPPLDPHRACARPTSTSPCSTTGSPSTPSRGSRPSASAASARRRTGSTAAAASPSTASCPVNPHGGQLSEGRTHGFGFIYEAVTQLRHEAGERQVADAGTRGGHLRRRHAVRRPAPPARRHLIERRPSRLRQPVGFGDPLRGLGTRRVGSPLRDLGTRRVRDPLSGVWGPVGFVGSGPGNPSGSWHDPSAREPVGSRAPARASGDPSGSWAPGRCWGPVGLGAAVGASGDPSGSGAAVGASGDPSGSGTGRCRLGPTNRSAVHRSGSGVLGHGGAGGPIVLGAAARARPSQQRPRWCPSGRGRRRASANG